MMTGMDSLKTWAIVMTTIQTLDLMQQKLPTMTLIRTVTVKNCAIRTLTGMDMPPKR